MTILVPLDTSDVSTTAVGHAEHLARALGEDLLLVTVADAATTRSVESPETGRAARRVWEERRGARLPGASAPSRIPRSDPSGPHPVEILEANLARAAETITGIDVAIDVIAGDDAADAIVTRADRPDVSMVVLATHGRTGLQRWPMGSVAERVVRSATVPVHVVPAPWRQRPTTPPAD